MVIKFNLEETMKNISLIFIALIMFSSTSYAEEPGTRDEATSLLNRAIALLNIDKNRALQQFTTGEGGMIQGDLYVFCFVSEGTLTAHPAAIGINIFSNPDLKDENGSPVGETMATNAKSGSINEVVYKLRKYDTDSEQEYTKTTLYTKVSDQICGVGYYN